MKTATEVRVERINIRVSEPLKRSIERAAQLQGLSVTAFIESELARTSLDIIDRFDSRRLSDRDRDIFLSVLDDDAEVSENLVRAYQRYRTRMPQSSD